VKTLFVYKYLDLGGVETVLASRLAGLPSLGVDAEAWFLRDGPGRDLFGASASRVHIGGVQDLQRHLEMVRPAVVCTIDTEEAFPALGDATKDRATVVEVHTPYRENRVYLGALGRAGVKAFLTPTQYQATLVARETGNLAPTYAIPNPLDRSFLGELIPFRSKPPRPVVAWVGRLDRLKNWNEYLRVAKVAMRGAGEVEFWLVGKTNEEGGELRLMREAKRQGVLGHLRWYRGVPHDRMHGLFDGVRESGGLVISTSMEESFGLGIAEAMARGCAVVVPRHSAFPEFVEDLRHGRLYRPGSAGDAAACVVSLLRDHSLREACGLCGRKDILARHAPEVSVPLLAERLRQLAPFA
jgi:glycosyltransferase involved in cell wall biosynthesis